MKYCPEFIEYIAIIANRQLNPLNENEYGEKHHIYPKSFGGSNKERNIVRLTPEEHYRCHSLLPIIFRDEPEKYKKMLCAWNFTHTTHSNMQISELEYGKLKREFSKAQRSRRHTDEVKEKIRQFNLAKKPYHLSEVARKNISNAHKGKTTWIKGLHHSEETKQKIRNSLKGRKCGVVTEETRKKLSQAAKGRKMSFEARRKMSEAKKLPSEACGTVWICRHH